MTPAATAVMAVVNEPYDRVEGWQRFPSWSRNPRFCPMLSSHRRQSILWRELLFRPGAALIMPDDPDIYRAAKLLADQHGEDAPIRAAERADGSSRRATPRALWSGG